MRLLLATMGAIASIALPTLAHADSATFGFSTNGRGGFGVQLGFATGNPGYRGGGAPGYGGYGRPAPVQLVPIPVQQVVPVTTYILVCDRGGVLGPDGRCHVTRRIR